MAGKLSSPLTLIPLCAHAFRCIWQVRVVPFTPAGDPQGVWDWYLVTLGGI